MIPFLSAWLLLAPVPISRSFPNYPSGQTGIRDDLFELRRYFGMSYRSTIRALDERNQILLHNTAPSAPAQVAEMQARMKAPDKLQEDPPEFSARVDNVGQGLVTFLFEGDFITQQVNFVFCPAQPNLSERVMAIQVLLDDRSAAQPALTLLQSVYRLPAPIASAVSYLPVLIYPIQSNLPFTVWDMTTAEALYQPVQGQRLISGQLWLADKTIAGQCSAIPKLPAIQ